MANTHALNSLSQHVCEQFLSSELFKQVQLSGIFDDSKTFADASLKTDWQTIEQAFERQSKQQGFRLRAFIDEHFVLPKAAPAHDPDLCNRVSGDLREYINALWPLLERSPDVHEADSLLPLQQPYMVPGGRFREIYYWDSYFTALGLIESGRTDMLKSMILNFITLQDQVGCIPNGNRHYYRSRSQPPVLALMIELLLEQSEQDSSFIQLCVEGLEKEYQFWMQGTEALSADKPSFKRVVRLAEGIVLNRYWDDRDAPRPESFKEDLESAQGLPEEQKREFYRNIRAACESGWDFSTRWLADKNDLKSILTTHVIPVDLNCLLLNVELQLAKLHQRLGQNAPAKKYESLAQSRKHAIQRYMWSDAQGWYCDFDWRRNTQTEVISLAGIVPLFVGIADQQQAQHLASRLMNDFLSAGGLVTSLHPSQQQWDTPNGWAPLHWFAVKGLLSAGFKRQARVIMQLWNATVENHFESHGHLMEKYNVVEPDIQATGGEYEVQHGFGWTNGVTLAFYRLLENEF